MSSARPSLRYCPWREDIWRPWMLLVNKISQQGVPLCSRVSPLLITSLCIVSALPVEYMLRIGWKGGLFIPCLLCIRPCLAPPIVNSFTLSVYCTWLPVFRLSDCWSVWMPDITSRLFLGPLLSVHATVKVWEGYYWRVNSFLVTVYGTLTARWRMF